MMEMISLYLKQTPLLIKQMKQGLADKDWTLLAAAVHKIIPSFYIMGISKDFELMAKKIQEYASMQQQLNELPLLVLQLEKVCLQACAELEIEYVVIKKTIKVGQNKNNAFSWKNKNNYELSITSYKNNIRK